MFCSSRQHQIFVDQRALRTFFKLGGTPTFTAVCFVALQKQSIVYINNLQYASPVRATRAKHISIHFFAIYTITHVHNTALSNRIAHSPHSHPPKHCAYRLRTATHTYFENSFKTVPLASARKGTNARKTPHHTRYSSNFGAVAVPIFI